MDRPTPVTEDAHPEPIIFKKKVRRNFRQREFDCSEDGQGSPQSYNQERSTTTVEKVTTDDSEDMEVS